MMRTTLRIFIALALAALIWWIGPLIAIGVYRPLAGLLVRQIIVTIILVWGFWPLLARLWGLLAMGPRHFKPAPKARSYDPITGRLRNLDRQLLARWSRQTHSRWQQWTNRFARRHLQALPWLLLLGPSGSGKTRMILSGSALAAVSHGAAATAWEGDAGGSDLNCWIGDNAVWLDAPGRWADSEALDEAGQRDWHLLLKGLRSLRSPAPLNGVVLTVDLQQLLTAPLETRRQLAAALHARLVDLGERLRQQPCVYLALTGLDKLDDAVAVLTTMNSQQWSGGLGFALPAPVADADAALLLAQWQEALQGLEERLQQQVLFSAPNTADPQLNRGLLRFADLVSQLRRPLLDLLAHALTPPQRDPVAQLRGVWWGSVAELVEDDPRDAGQAPGPMRGLGALWSPLLKQAAEASGTGAATPTRRRLRQARWALAGLAGAAFAGWLGWGYVQELNNIERVWAHFNEGKRLAQLQATEVRANDTPLLEVVEQMAYARGNLEDAGRVMPTGYVEHRRVAAAADSTYQRHLRKMLMPELYNNVQQTLIEQTKGTPGDLYLTLKVYLMLTRPERRDAEALGTWIQQRWKHIAGHSYGEEDLDLLRDHAAALFALPHVPGTPENAELVRAARAAAANTPSVTRVIQHIRAQGLPPGVADISLARAAGFSASTQLRLRSDLPLTDAAVPGWFTRAGYLENFVPRLRTAARAVMEEENWVLRDQNADGNAFEFENAVERLADATQRQFLRDYVQQWQNFLNDVTVRSFTGLADAAQLASTLIEPQSSLAQLLRFVGRETTLTGNYEGDVDSWIDKQKYRLERSRRAVVGEIAGERVRNGLLPEHVVEDHFEAVRRLGTQLAQASTTDASNPLARLFEPLYRQLGLVDGALQAGQVPAEYDAFARLRNVAATQPEPIRGIMLDLVNNGSRMSARQTAGVISRDASGAVKGLCDMAIEGRYLLARGARAEAGVHDYERLFGPQGAMATEFRDKLARYVDTSTRPWRSRRADAGDQGSGGPLLSAEMLRSYEAAQTIRGTTLDESGKLRISAVVRFIEMDPQLTEATLDIGGQSLRYAHGVASPRRIDWSSSSNPLSIRLQLRAVDGRTDVVHFDGPWALFRFFDSGKSPEGSGDAGRRETLYQTSLGTVRLEWQSTSTPAPLWSNLLGTFRCPRG